MYYRPIRQLSGRSLASFWARVDRRGEDGCWIWRGALDAKGYGRFGRDGLLAHRISAHLAGTLDDDLPLDHLCRNHACVNPAHLDAVSHRENILRSPIAPAAINRRRVTCKEGHPLDIIVPRSNRRVGYARACSICKRQNARERMRRFRARKRLQEAA